MDPDTKEMLKLLVSGHNCSLASSWCICGTRPAALSGWMVLRASFHLGLCGTIKVWVLKGQRHGGFATSRVGVFLTVHSDNSLTKESITRAGWSPILRKPVSTLCAATAPSTSHTFPEEFASTVSGLDAVTDPIVPMLFSRILAACPICR